MSTVRCISSVFAVVVILVVGAACDPGAMPTPTPTSMAIEVLQEEEVGTLPEESMTVISATPTIDPTATATPTIAPTATATPEKPVGKVSAELLITEYSENQVAWMTKYLGKLWTIEGIVLSVRANPNTVILQGPPDPFGLDSDFIGGNTIEVQSNHPDLGALRPGDRITADCRPQAPTDDYGLGVTVPCN